MLREQTSSMKFSQTWAKTSTGEAKEPVENWRRQCVGFGWATHRVFRLKMFHDDRGSWMTSFMTTVLVLFIFSYIYNAVLMIGGDDTRKYHISSYMGVSNSIFMKAAATGTWCGDFFTAWMVTDMMLQERLYPDWARPLRKWWNTGIRRILLFWVVVASTSFVVIFVIATDYINWDSLNRDFLHSNEISRAFLASFILCLDITIVMQAYDLFQNRKRLTEHTVRATTRWKATNLTNLTSATEILPQNGTDNSRVP
ncbi:transmembrane protein 117 [Plakobranchus ocellatus]|uniref:Transmembrane protein 117 n=1 Tax=Plakobranchus ocellatus TaxID=259542 RepID=A0AAV4BUX9_9GAST|nr:transmembrane protein 117 [Plakobranchus ocellatus]